MCGENIWRTEARSGKKGSPPRVRGKRITIKNWRVGKGITPACAGKTKQEEYIYGDTEDHPRVCGENSKQGFSRPVEAGSPPRVRGKHAVVGGFFCAQRITPACAGKTGFLVVAAHGSKDHPRVCGENKEVHKDAGN